MYNDNKINSFDEVKTIMGNCLKLIHKVYISYIKHIYKKYKNETIEIKYLETSFIIKKNLEKIFIDYKKYIENKVNSDQNYEILEKKKIFFELKSSDLLKFSGKFPFKNEKTSVEIDENIKEIINDEIKYNEKLKKIKKFFLNLKALLKISNKVEKIKIDEDIKQAIKVEIENHKILKENKNCFELKFSDLLKISNEFLFKKKDTFEIIEKIINKVSDNIIIFENKLGIFLDKLEPNENIKRHKRISKNYYKILLDNGDYYLYTQLLKTNCYEIINVCFFQDQKTTYEKYYNCSVVVDPENSSRYLLLNPNKSPKISQNNSSSEKEKKENVVNCNNQEGLQNTSKSILTPNYSQSTQTVCPEFLNDENESLQNKSQNFLNKKREKKKIVVNSNIQEALQNTQKILPIPNNSQVIQTFHSKFPPHKEKNNENESSQNILNKKSEKDLNFSTEKEKKEIDDNSDDYHNSENINNIFSEKYLQYKEQEKEKNNTYIVNNDLIIENMSTRNNETEKNCPEINDVDFNSNNYFNSNSVDPKNIDRLLKYSDNSDFFL